MKNELLRMYKYPSMIKTMTFCAAVFGFIAVVFKSGIVLIPEVSEVRFCNILSCSFGIMFGPAGAWGCAVGNLIGDMAGSLTVLSPYGFAANFFSAWIPYKVWCVTGAFFNENRLERPSLKSTHCLMRFLFCGFGSAVSCCIFLALIFDWYGSMPCANSFLMLICNNTVATALSLPLFVIMSNLPEKFVSYWRVQMTDEKDYAFRSSDMGFVYVLMIVSAVFCVFTALYAGFRGLSFRIMDEFREFLPCAASAVCSAVIIVSAALCRWEEKNERSECERPL